MYIYMYIHVCKYVDMHVDMIVHVCWGCLFIMLKEIQKETNRDLAAASSLLKWPPQCRLGQDKDT